MLQVTNLSKSFTGKNKKTIFDGFDLTIKNGEKVGLFGTNGSGKTTLLNILSQVDKNYSGNFNHSSERVAYIHQDYNATLLPWFSARKNILLAREYYGLDVEKGEGNLNNLEKELGIDFSLDTHTSELSGGQKQVVALMRALIVEPTVLLMDEPFSALDVERREKVMSVLEKNLSLETKLVITSHRGEEVSGFINRAIVLENQPGKITVDKYLDEKDTDAFSSFVKGLRFNKK